MSSGGSIVITVSVIPFHVAVSWSHGLDVRPRPGDPAMPGSGKGQLCAVFDVVVPKLVPKPSKRNLILFWAVPDVVLNGCRRFPPLAFGKLSIGPLPADRQDVAVERAISGWTVASRIAAPLPFVNVSCQSAHRTYSGVEATRR